LTKPVRLDAELVRRHLAGSRAEARRAIESGLVVVNGIPAAKPATLVDTEASVNLKVPPGRFVSRGGEKLDGALARLDIEVAGRRWLDAGASTGGFTDRLLRGGADAVVCVDVGYGQLDWRIRNDDRVIVIERSNVRHLKREDLPWPPEGVTADLSFISLTLVIPSLANVAADDADFVLLVKPQFEVGKGAVGKGGVVREPGAWRAALERVVGAGEQEGLGLGGACRSSLTGPAGNHEFFVHLRRGASSKTAAIEEAIGEASP
jgi:23S rRNA (cytidine1920-2'-O)/16S rRNA (cytidine1409-2'-O)-methyltransferase